MHWSSAPHLIWMAFLWLVAIYFVVAAIMFIADAFRARGESHESAESVLRRRYAAGEIDTEEFERRLAQLSKTQNAA